MKDFSKFFKDINDNIERSFPFLQPKPLETEFNNTVRFIKERNSQIVWSHYYIPLAIREILERDGYLLAAESRQVQHLALAKMHKDLSTGELTELYRFKDDDEV